MQNLQEAHQLRLKMLLDSGRLTPVASPTASPSPNPAEQAGAAATESQRKNNRKRRAARKPDLSALAASTPHFLPDAMNYIVCVSTRSADVELENDHNLHCLCSFPTRQHAYDWVVKHRLALARHYLRDPRLSARELEQLGVDDGCGDQFYLGEATSLEIVQVPQFKSAETAPSPSVEHLLFGDRFITYDQEEQYEQAQGLAPGGEEDKTLDAGAGAWMAAESSAKAGAMDDSAKAAPGAAAVDPTAQKMQLDEEKEEAPAATAAASGESPRTRARSQRTIKRRKV